MQEADEATVLGDFNNVKFKHFAVESTFFKRDGKFMVRTDGPDGKPADYAISRTFGVWPLQQYMVAFPGGRYQMLPIAWDARTQAEGGQRWFHLSPGEKMEHKDPLHWTGRYQNWNLQCAACHSTNLVKGYDAASDSYKTTFSEINVSCEACHGPASRHMAWAAKAKAPYAPGSDKGLVSLKSRWQDAWKFRSATAPHAQRDKPADAAVMNSCAACHARRSTLVEHGAPGGPLEDTHRLAMLTSPTFHADGQQLDEVFVWNSWLQTKMHQRGVTCMDCHDAHTAKLRVEGNAVCARCHNAAVFDTEKHSFHKPGSKGAQCVECHMPEKNYMVVDARRDHAIRVPRPDLSKTLGTPNACNQCHTDRKPDWAATAMDQWYGSNWRARPQYGTTFQAGATQGAAAAALPDGAGAGCGAAAHRAGHGAHPGSVLSGCAGAAGPAQAARQHRPDAAHRRARRAGPVRTRCAHPGRRAPAQRRRARGARGSCAHAGRHPGCAVPGGPPRRTRSRAQGVRGLAQDGCRLALRQRQPRQPVPAPAARWTMLSWRFNARSRWIRNSPAPP